MDRQKWTEEFLEACKQKDASKIEHMVDFGLRHKKGTPYEYLENWLMVARLFGIATKDDSWGEFEKEFSIIIRRLIIGETPFQDTSKGEEVVQTRTDVIVGLIRDLAEELLGILLLEYHNKNHLQWSSSPKKTSEIEIALVQNILDVCKKNNPNS